MNVTAEILNVTARLFCSKAAANRMGSGPPSIVAGIANMPEARLRLIVLPSNGCMALPYTVA